MIGSKYVYKINGTLVIGDNIEDAISIYNEYYQYTTIKSVELVKSSSYGSYMAICREEGDK